MKMVRKQVYITKEQDEELKQAARRLSVTEAELIRRGIDEVTRLDNSETRKEAWKRLEALMDARMKLKVPQQPRTWTRDELYDERPRYLSR
jgi:hypothetical protein